MIFPLFSWKIDPFREKYAYFIKYNFIDIHKKWGEAMKDALLDYIFDNCDAAYISDLRQKMIF